MKPSTRLRTTQRSRLIPWLRLTGALLLSVGAGSADTMSQVGAWPGYTRHTLRQVWPEETNVFLTTAEGVQLLDFSNPLQPQEHSFLTCLEWWELPTDIALQTATDRLCVGVGVSYQTYQNRVKGIDVSNLAHPQLVWQGPLDHRPNQIAQDGDRVYSSHQTQGLSVSTWGSAGSPSRPSAITNASGRVVVVGTRLYVPTASGFQIFSKSSYALQGTFDAGAKVEAMAVDGTQAYLAETDGLRIVDVTFPAAMSSVGFLPLATEQYHPIDLALLTNHACLIFQETNLLMVVDVETPATPVEVGSHPFLGPTTDLALTGERAFVMAADSDGGAPDLHVLSLTNPASPVLETRLYAAGNSRELAFDASTLFIADYNNGLVGLDVEPPTSPQIISHRAGDGYCIAGANDHIYLGANLGGFSVFDVSSPEAPMLVTNVPAVYPVRRIEVGEDLLYRIEGYPGSEELAVADITSGLAEVGRKYSWDLGIFELQAFGVAGDQFAMVVDSWQGTLIVIDAQATGLPVVTNYSATAKITDVVGRVDETGTNAFLATTNGLEILDLSNPNHITSLGQWNCPAELVPYRLCVDGHRIGLVATNHLWVIDANKLGGAEPVIAELAIEHVFSDIALSGNLLVGATGADGIVLYRIGAAPPQAQLSIIDAPPDHVTLDWGAAGTGWFLQQSETADNSGSWVNVAGSESVTSTNLSREAAARFFRLKQ